MKHYKALKDHLLIVGLPTFFPSFLLSEQLISQVRKGSGYYKF